MASPPQAFAAMTERHLVDRLPHLAGWDDMDAQERLAAVLGAGLDDVIDIGGFDLDDLAVFAVNDDWAEGDEATDEEVHSYANEFFITNPDDKDSLYYLTEKLEEIESTAVKQDLCEFFPELELSYESFDTWLSESIAELKRSLLGQVAGRGTSATDPGKM